MRTALPYGPSPLKDNPTYAAKLLDTTQMIAKKHNLPTDKDNAHPASCFDSPAGVLAGARDPVYSVLLMNSTPRSSRCTWTGSRLGLAITNAPGSPLPLYRPVIRRT